MKNLQYKNIPTMGAFTVIFFSIVSLSSASTGGAFPSAMAGLVQLRAMLATSFAPAMATIALAVGLVGYLLSSDPDLAPVLRVLIRIVLACSLMAGGSFIIENVIGLTASTI